MVAPTPLPQPLKLALHSQAPRALIMPSLAAYLFWDIQVYNSQSEQYLGESSQQPIRKVSETQRIIC